MTEEAAATVVHLPVDQVLAGTGLLARRVLWCGGHGRMGCGERGVQVGHRSSRASMPIDRRSRSSGPGRRASPGCVGVDQALDPAQRGGPLEHPDRAQHRHGLLGAARQPDRQHPAEPAVHLAGRDLVAGCDGSPGYSTAASAGCPWRWRAMAMALSEARCTRRNRVRMPRYGSHASNGPGTAPALRRQERIRSQKGSRRAVRTAPANTRCSR